MRQCALTPHFFKFAFSPFNSERGGGYMYSAVFYAVMHGILLYTLHLFIIWFTDILANLDVQTELQDCLYEYGFKDS